MKEEQMNQKNTKQRLVVVDALRGFAIVSIMLLHNIEHFDLYFGAEGLPAWMQSLDKVIWGIMFFLFSGKSYAIFALLFGLTFFIQMDNQAKKGNDFRARFAWRLLLLFGFGIINSAFFQGDILTIYAALGLLLIPYTKISNTVILVVACLLMLLPVEIVHLIRAFQQPDTPVGDPIWLPYYLKIYEYLPKGSFINSVVGNLTNGKKTVTLWNWDNGRVFSIFALFLFGYIAGRKRLFVWSEETRIFWRRMLIYAFVVFLPLFIAVRNLENWVESDAIRTSLQKLLSTWSNTAFMLVMVAGFILLFQSTALRRPLNYFSSFGKMSLSNYVMQSILGSVIYYGFGLGLYKYTGATYGLLIGVVLTALLGFFCSWWAKHFKHGPLETLWHKGTWLGSSR